MLKGKAKTDYMREYMRRRRAGQAKPKPAASKPKTPETAPPRKLDPLLDPTERLASKREFMLLRGENAKLKSANAKLRAMLQEDPDAAKLRKKVAEAQMELASMRQAMKRLAKERDQYKRRSQPKYREAARLLTASTYRVIIKALHPDRARHVAAAELAEAGRLAAALRPLFVEQA